MTIIIDIIPSPLKLKRYRATVLLHNGEQKTIDFGSKGSSTYIDGKRTKNERLAYLKRHLANPKENELINSLIASPSTMSCYLLWGPTKSLDANVQELNRLWKTK